MAGALWEEHPEAERIGDGPKASGAMHGVNRRLYIAVAAGSVLLSAGRYEASLAAYGEAEAEADQLPSGHPNRAIMHSGRAFALYALGRLELAFEDLVKVSAHGLTSFCNVQTGVVCILLEIYEFLVYNLSVCPRRWC